MKPKVLKSLLITVTLFTIVIASLWYYDTKDYYQSGENDTFNVSVGDTFSVELNENGSTGYANCWRYNKIKINLIDSDYSPGLNAKMGYDGAGGITRYTFKALKEGVDTLYVASRPISHDRKDCSEYVIECTTADNIFIVEIEK